MVEEDLSQISVGEFETVGQLLSSSESLQIAFFIMIAGMIGIALGYIGRNLVEAEAGAVEAAEQRIVDALRGRFHRHNDTVSGSL